MKIVKSNYCSEIKKNIYFCHLINKKNVGDFNCCPLDYYSFDSKTKVNIKNTNRLLNIKNSIVVIGGGGLLHHRTKWNQNIDLLKFNKNIIIGWGIGSNIYYNSRKEKCTNLTNFDLLGVRDYLPGLTHVPCVTCKSPYFDLYKNVDPLYENGYIHHASYILNNSNPKHSISCKTKNMEYIIKFISKYKKIHTNSYHASYWSLLMNKKVNIVDAWSSKFDLMEFKKECPNDYLKKCRQKNDKFFEEIKKLTFSL
jgi:exopolysaccharide biosynthesis predicted pyruvyltransferase EpsI